jgi:Tfp pilus assembly protein PilF
MRVQTGEEDEACEALFAYVLKKHPESQIILETVARAYMHRFRFGPAYACLTYWIDIAPDKAKPYHWRGWVLERMNSTKLAMNDYQRALQLDPSLEEIRLHLGELLMDDNKPIEALAYLEPLHSQFPDRADIKARLGQCFYLQGRTREAARLLESAIEKLPDDGALLLCLAKIDLARGRPAVAETRLRHALAIDPSDTESHFNLVAALRDQDRNKEASQELAAYEEEKALLFRAHELLQAEAKNPSSDPKAASEIGTLLLRFGQVRQGLYWLDQALERDPDHQPTHKAYAEYFESKGESKKAEAHRRKIRPPT